MQVTLHKCKGCDGDRTVVVNGSDSFKTKNKSKRGWEKSETWTTLAKG